MDHLWTGYETLGARGCAWDMPEGVYASRSSVAAGGIIDLCISTSRPCQQLLLFREAECRELVRTVRCDGLRLQPVAESAASGGAFGWEASLSVPIPAAWPSGVYIAQVQTGFGAREALFVVRPAAGAPSACAIAWVLADSTYTAYNAAGGKSTYNFQSTEKRGSARVSFARPLSGSRFLLLPKTPDGGRGSLAFFF